MQGCTAEQPARDGKPAREGMHRPWTPADWKLLALLVLLAAGLRTWQLTHTEVAARDSIGFIRIAWQLHQAPVADWSEVLAGAEQHPAYPVAVCAASGLLRQFVEAPEVYLMQWGAQGASALAAVLLVLPVYCLGRELFDRRVGFWSALVLQVLPVSGSILADGLSESLFLLFATSALFWSVRALGRPRAPAAFALTGAFGALAYLTRPEGALIVAATGLVLLGGQAVRAWRRRTRDLLVCGTALCASALLLAAPFVAVTGQLTVKPSGQRILRPPPACLHARVQARRHAGGPWGDTPSAKPQVGYTGNMLFASWRVWDSDPAERFWWGMGALGKEIIEGSFYVGWLATLFGLWRYRERFRPHPGAWMMLLVCLGVAFALWRVAVVVGYTSDRHALLILTCGLFWAVAGSMAFAEVLARWFPRIALRSQAHRAALLPLLFVLIALPKNLRPLHEHRAGFRAAGLWLAEHSAPGDAITDPFCWAHYYSGRVFLEGTRQPVPKGRRPKEFIVIDDARNAHPRLPTYESARKKAGQGEVVYRWKGQRDGKKAEVLVYAVPRETQ